MGSRIAPMSAVSDPDRIVHVLASALVTTERRQALDIEGERARIVRALFDATDILSRDPDPDGAARARAGVARLRSDAQALGDPELVAAVDRALDLLLPDRPDDAGT